jgi:hypothetical protein
MTKARLVEEVVSLFHQEEGVIVERNVRLPSLSDSSQIREVDVLISGTVAGYPIRIPIECKNYQKRITAGQIGEFRDKLEDVGLPVRDSIYVCVSGFGRDARRRALDHGIKLFRLDGLSPDRLSSAIHQAFQSTVYYLLRVENVTVEPYLEGNDLWPLMWFIDARGNIRGGIWDLIWEQWKAGIIPTSWGVQELVVTPPPGWRWYPADPRIPRYVTATLRVVGLVLTAHGEAHRHILHDILDRKLDRAHIRAIFADDPGSISLTVVDDQEQFQAATRREGVANIVVTGLRCPRIHVLGKIYWPPTERAASVTKAHVDRMMTIGNADWDSLKELTFEELEGPDIAAIWGKTWSGHPSARGEDWPRKFPAARRRARRRPS